MTEEIKKETAEEVVQETTEETTEETATVEKELNDKYLRLMAEFDNFKKRTAKEKTQIYTIAAAEVVEAILPVLDNFERAVADKDNVSYDGIVLIKRQFDEILEKLGVKVIESVGKPLNPEVHNAVMHIDDENIEGESIIVEEFGKGYMYKEKVIRHSTVKVAN
ncbi:MAG: nucleotide exchange factor GrpE [Clostridia bacterium]|nr:nucleotide exchange factor GrpE [Clostridia bacterium]